MRELDLAAGLSRVCITGCCLIAPLPQKDERIARITLSPDELLSPERSRRLDPWSQLALIAVEHARRQAQLAPNNRKDKLATEGVALGSALGAVVTTVRYAKRLVDAGPTATNPIDFPDSIDGAAAGHVALDLGLSGPSVTFTDGPFSAVSALVYAARQIAWRRATRMHVVAGDKFDSLLGTALGGDPSLASVVPSEFVLALVLEAFDEAAAPTKPAIEVNGFFSSASGDSTHEARHDLDRLHLSWVVEGGSEIQLLQRPASGQIRLQDPSGALDLAGAWVFLRGATTCVLGNTSVRLPTPTADAVHCGDRRYPNLQLTRTPSLLS